jgi:hypothetical protein
MFGKFLIYLSVLTASTTVAPSMVLTAGLGSWMGYVVGGVVVPVWILALTYARTLEG